MSDNKEKIYRYESDHFCHGFIEWCKTPDLPDKGLTPFALAMPDELKSNDAVSSYRKYYATKTHLFKWTKRERPEWIV